jgi:hypothetical protein
MVVVGATFSPDFDLDSYIKHVGQSVQANRQDQYFAIGYRVSPNPRKLENKYNQGYRVILELVIGPAKLGQCIGRT